MKDNSGNSAANKKSGQKKNQNKEFEKIQEAEAAYDAAQKQILSIPYVIAGLLKAWNVLEEDLSIEDLVKLIVTEPEEASGLLGGRLNQENPEISIPGYGRTEFDLHFRIPAKALKKESFRGVDLVIEIQSQITPSKQVYFNRLAVYRGRLITSQGKGKTMKKLYEDLEPVCLFSIILNPPDYMKNSWLSFGPCLKEMGGFEKPDKVDKNVNRYLSSVNLEETTTYVLFLGDPGKIPWEWNEKNKMLYLLDSLLSPRLSLKEKNEAFKRIFGIPLSEEETKEVNDMGNSATYLIALGKEEGRAEGMKEGREEGTRETLLRVVRSIMHHSSFNTVDAALNLMGIKDRDERQYVINSLTSDKVKK